MFGRCLSSEVTAVQRNAGDFGDETNTSSKSELSAVTMSHERVFIPLSLWERNAREGLMTRVYLSEVLAETALVAYSGGFLVLYVVVKLSHLSIMPWLSS